MNNPDERLCELEIARCDDGDILLSQGYDLDGDGYSVRLHRCHLDLLASLTGFVSENEVARTCGHLKDRLHLLAAMVEAHTRPGDALRAAVAAIVPDAPRHITAPYAPHLSPENALPVGDTDDSVRAELLRAIRASWEAGEAFAASASGHNGMHARRFEMPECFHEKPRQWFEEQTGRLLAEGSIKRMTHRGGARLVPADAESAVPTTPEEANELRQKWNCAETMQ